MIKVFGHSSPDTDATCAPIAYAWLLKKMGKKAEAYIQGDLNRETNFVLKKARIKAPKILKKLSQEDEVVIIDTNNPDELPKDLHKATIKTIIDHHKLSGLTTKMPLEVYIEPVGASSTLVYKLMKKASINPSQSMALILLSAIISDTLNLNGPTATSEDKKAVSTLIKIAKVDLSEHVRDMFAAKSDLTGISARKLVLTDSKVYEFNGKKVCIAVHETTDPNNAKNMDLVAEMEKIKNSEKLHSVFFFIVDILKNHSSLLVTNGAEGLAKMAFKKDFSNGFMELPGIVSRKKQMAPNIEKATT